MKILITILVAVVAIIFFAWPDKPSDDQNEPSGSNQTSQNPAINKEAGSSPGPSETDSPVPSSRQREVTEVPKKGTWHPTEKGQLISPYNNEVLAAIGVVSGSKMKDADGKTFIVPSFEDSPFPIQPIAAHVPGQPGFVFNPWTQKAIDVRGLSPGTLIRDPADPDPSHKIRTPSAKEK